MFGSYVKNENFDIEKSRVLKSAFNNQDNVKLEIRLLITNT